MRIQITDPNGTVHTVEALDGATVTINPPQQYPDGLGGFTTDPTKAWETGEATTPPLEAMTLIGLTGPGGQRTIDEMRRYHRTYHERWGWQCTLPGAGINKEDHAKCEFAAIADAWKPAPIVPGI